LATLSPFIAPPWRVGIVAASFLPAEDDAAGSDADDRTIVS
jgi:hypothetical protein